MGKLNWGKRTCVVVLLCAASAIALRAQTVTTLVNFNGTNGQSAYGPLVQGTNGSFYGTTYAGGLNFSGTVFQINSVGTLTTLYTFQGTAGAQPFAGLALGTDGNLYGTTTTAGLYGSGTVFKITSGGTLTALHNFDGPDGASPFAGLVQATDGNFYGTTYNGGINSFGTIFGITPKGTLTTLYSFCSQGGCVDGQGPYTAALIQATDGNLYGTTAGGGANGNYGTVFKMTPNGTLTTLYSFCSESGCTDGAFPYAGLVQGTDSNFYGTTYGGGNGYGTVFKITPTGTLTTLYSFCAQSGCTDGSNPYAGLVLATDGNFYGTTYLGGANVACFGDSCGTIFKITPTGTLTTLYTFAGYPIDGGNPYGSLLQATSGTFYGTTLSGGGSGVGVVYSLSVGLGPFVKTQPSSGKVGVGIKILGTNLTGATSVTFNGTAAVFHVASSSLITATVPTGATNGKVQVVTPGGTLSSNVPFRVRP